MSAMIFPAPPAERTQLRLAIDQLYRADETPLDVALVATSEVDVNERPADPPRGVTESGDAPDPMLIMLAAIETMAHTVAAANRMFLAAASLMGAPIEITRKILGI